MISVIKMKSKFFIGASIFLIIILIFVAAFIFDYFRETPICEIEYGKVECIDEKPVIAFFNPNETDLENIRITMSTDMGTDVYEVNESLKSNTTEVLILSYTPCSVNQASLKVSWCCGKCFSTYMKNPSEDISIKMVE